MTVRSLKAAHAGYMYQDMVTAYVLLQALLFDWDVSVDKKNFAGDVFDDIKIFRADGVWALQLKSTLDQEDQLELADISTNRRKTRLDVLVESVKQDGQNLAQSRLCTTWAAPTEARLLGYLAPDESGPILDGFTSLRFRLRSDAIWPAGAEPEIGDFQSHQLSQQDFVAFCSKFVLEIGCPRSSYDLNRPGPLEELLLTKLVDEIGVGTFPNRHKDPVDTAARLIHFAQRARKDQLKVTGRDVLLNLGLQTDFGRVPQLFPVNAARFVRQEARRDALLEHTKSGKITVLTGEPGSGKSWLLTELAARLREKGRLVAQHYCYLEPTDREVQRRITSTVMFGNLISDIFELRPALRSKQRPLFAATPDSFEDLLETVSKSEEVFLIVDGLDHISRVFQQSRMLAGEDVDIIEQLALLKLPENVHLVIGSQPGPHLPPLLEGGNQIELGPWNQDDIEALADRMGLYESLRAHGFHEELAEITKELHERTEGNPLYSTFACKELLRRLSAGHAQDPIHAIRELPVLEGDLGTYYAYLFSHIEDDSSIQFAEILGLIDFAVTASDLTAITPANSHRVQPALLHLESVLENVTEEGALRIYHESFRRYVAKRLKESGASIAAILDPVCGWLERKGFPRDSRAYRFLMPTLRRSGRDRDLLALVRPTFFSDSLAEGQPPSAIAHNLMTAAQSAADAQDWPALAKIVELQRANATYLQERFSSLRDLASGFASVRGAAALNERLTFEGRTTYGFEAGLLLCKLCDDGGSSPPWQAYLELRSSAEDSPFAEYEIGLAWFQGQLRTRGLGFATKILVDWGQRILNRESGWGLIRRAVRLMGKLQGDSALTGLANQTLPPSMLTIVKLELATLKRQMGKLEEAAQIATSALNSSLGAEPAEEAVRLGAPPSVAATCCIKFDEFDPVQARLTEDLAEFRAWKASLAIEAFTHPELLDSESQRVGGEGWFRLWLQFVITLARASAVASKDKTAGQSEVLAAFQALASDTRPFVGSPRACDLYYLHSIIRESIKEALSLLVDDPQKWNEAIPLLIKISEGTSTYFQREESGPFDSDALISTVRHFALRPQLTDLLLPVLESRVARRVIRTGFYSSFAEGELELLKVYSALSRLKSAEEHWQNVCVYMAGYGYRKDVTIFELLDSLEKIAPLDQARASEAAQSSQRLAYAVLAHTDGKETRYAPQSWFEAAFRARPVDSLVLLSQAFSSEGGTINWTLEASLRRTLRRFGTSANPLVLHFLWASLVTDEAAKDIDIRLEIVQIMWSQDQGLAEHLLRTLAAEVQGDGSKFSQSAAARVEQFAAKKQISIQRPLPIVGASDKQESNGYAPVKQRAFEPPVCVFPVEATTPLSMLKALRDVRFPEDIRRDRLVNALGYRILELCSKGAETEAESLLKYFARQHTFYSGADALADIGAGLESRGYLPLSATAYALAYTRSRGDGGWSVLGGERCTVWFRKAFQLDRARALAILGEDIARWVDGEAYVIGVSKHLVELFAELGDIDTAYAIWQAAFEVIHARLPGADRLQSAFPEFRHDVHSSLRADEALTLVLLARIQHPDQRKKNAAVAGLAQIISFSPDIVACALKEFLVGQYSFTAKLVALTALLKFEPSPFRISSEIRPELNQISESTYFGIAQCSKLLLERVQKDFSLPPRQRVSLPVSLLPPKKMEAVLSLDRGRRFARLSELWEDFPTLVAGRFDQLWEQPANKEIEKERFEIVARAERKKISNVPLLLWSHELYEAAFHEVLNHLDLELAMRGMIVPRILDSITRFVLPRVAIHVARTNSRVVRPDIPLPSKQGGSSLPDVLDTPAEYQGWKLCAYYEQELVEKNWAFEETVTAAQGVEVGLLPPDDDSLLPLGVGHVESWFQTPDQPPASASFTGPLVGLGFSKDFLGIFPVLIFAPALVSLFDYTPEFMRGPLRLVDPDKRPAVVFRQWTLRPVGDDEGEAEPRLHGCDLIVRPDVWARISGTVGKISSRTFRSSRPLNE